MVGVVFHGIGRTLFALGQDVELVRGFPCFPCAVVASDPALRITIDIVAIVLDGLGTFLPDDVPEMPFTHVGQNGQRQDGVPSSARGIRQITPLQLRAATWSQP